MKPEMLTTTTGDLPLAEYHLTLDTHTWRILHTRAILSLAAEQSFLAGEQIRMPYGIVLWPAAIALAHEIASRPVAGQKILELGAGTGLPGIVAASYGADVTQTDRSEISMHVCQRNAAANKVKVTQRVSDWTMWEEETGLYDIILGSDVMYAEFMHEHLRAIFENNLAPGGKILLSDPFREASFLLLEEMEASGWKITMNKWTVGVEPPMRPIAVFELMRT